MNHKIKLNQGALALLKNFVGQTGWAKTIEHIVSGGALMSKLPEVAVLDPKAKEPEVQAWIAVDFPEFEVTEKERDGAKAALKHFVELGAVPPFPHAVSLLKQFGLTE